MRTNDMYRQLKLFKFEGTHMLSLLKMYHNNFYKSSYTYLFRILKLFHKKPCDQLPNNKIGGS